MTVRFIRWPELKKRVGRSRSQIWRDERAGLFPARRRLGKNSVAWVESEIEEWITKRPKICQVEMTGLKTH